MKAYSADNEAFKNDMLHYYLMPLLKSIWNRNAKISNVTYMISDKYKCDSRSLVDTCDIILALI